MSITKRDAIAIWERHHGRCFWCDEGLDSSEVEFDHWMPLGLGGPDKPENIVISCRDCNRQKGNLHPHEYRLNTMAGYGGRPPPNG
jgi:5-methylcytosine-specific restriction endonuclease McrA